MVNIDHQNFPVGFLGALLLTDTNRHVCVATNMFVCEDSQCYSTDRIARWWGVPIKLILQISSPSLYLFSY